MSGFRVAPVDRPLVIFTEGDVERGLGHIGRCRPFAEFWAARGGDVHWRVDGDTAAAQILAGQAVSWGAWQTTTDFDDIDGAVVVVDSYSVSAAAMAAIAAPAHLAIFIDDLERDDYPVGLVLHGPPSDLKRKNRVARWLIGPRWRPMAQSFSDLPRRGPPKEPVESVLVLMGGTDLRALGPRMARVAREVFVSAEVIMVVGTGASHVETADVTIRRAVSADIMRDLMSRSDIAVSAAGQTLFELAATGLPAIGIEVAWNQKTHLAQWAKQGSVLAAGAWDDDDLDAKVTSALTSLRPTDRRAALSARGQNAVDGCAMHRLEKAMRLLCSGPNRGG